MKFCLLFNLSPCARHCLLIGSQLTTWSQGNLHYIRLHFFQLDREFFCLLPSLTRLYSAAASPSERLRSDGSLAKNHCLFRSVVSFTTIGYSSVLYLETYRAKAAIAHANSMMALTIGTLAPLHRSPSQ